MSSNKENLRRNIRQRRLEAKLSQRALGKLCKRTDRFISALETTPKNVTLETLELLAEALQCTIFDLLGPVRGNPPSGSRAKRSISDLELPQSAAVGIDAAIRILNRAKRSIRSKS